MQFCFEARCPRQDCAFGIDERGIISRNRFIGRLGLNRKAPDVTFPWAVRVYIVDLVDPPVIGRAINKTVRIRISGKAGNKIHRFQVLIASECFALACGIVHIVKIIAQIHIMRNRESSRFPGKARPCLWKQSAIFRIRTRCIRPYFT